MRLFHDLKFQEMGKPKKMKMIGKRRTPEQIVRLLKTAEAQLGSGATVEDVCRELEIAVSTFHHWRKKYGNMEPGDAKRLKALEDENSRLKKMVAEQALDIEMLKVLSKGNF
jgi:putative transposase